MIGHTIAHYRITAKLGEGGMGTVYRAVDTKLNREVAIKVLPDSLRSDPVLVARLTREAQVLALLNHPNIAAVYGVEDQALVMELVEGQTLSEVIADAFGPARTGPLMQGGKPGIEPAMGIARQIVDALDAAHEKGIVHRDLKPANVKITPEGIVKVLDFGIAKAILRDSSEATTLDVTRDGVLLGTVGYMAPEQARGKPVDKRADIWAFGAVLFELLSGRRAFAGDTATDALAAIVQLEPEWSALPEGAPVALLRRCLEKDPKRRLRDIGDAFATSDGMAPSLAPAARTKWTTHTHRWAAPAVVVVSILFVAWLWRERTPTSESPLMRFSLNLTPNTVLDLDWSAAALISPDGRRLVYSSRDATRAWRLYSRTLDQTEAELVPGVGPAYQPFLSPDGKWIAYLANGALHKVPVQGGVPVALTKLDVDDYRGASWAADGSIILATRTGGLSSIPSDGGTSKPVTQLSRDQDEVTHRWPQALPGPSILFTAGKSTPDFNNATVDIVSLSTGQRRTLAQGYHGRFLPTGSTGTGHLAFVQRDTLFAAPMDLRRLEVTGPARPVVSDVLSNPDTGGAQFDFSASGTLVFVKGKSTGRQWSVVWLDSTGRTQALRATPGEYTFPRFSPDGKRLALVVADGRDHDIWVYDWSRDTMSRLTYPPGTKSHPVWSPGGDHIAFAIDKGTEGSIEWIRADGAGETQRLIQRNTSPVPSAFTPDGRHLVFTEFSTETGNDIWSLPLDGGAERLAPGQPVPFLRSAFQERYPALSPDGRWLAYMSNESGTEEIFVRPFPGPGAKALVSSSGGIMPIWSRPTRELFYRTLDNHIMVSTYTVSGSTFTASRARRWTDAQIADRGSYINFDLAPDGTRFAAFVTPNGGPQRPGPTELTFLLNFFDELRRRDP